jgi:hypothetical protein
MKAIDKQRFASQLPEGGGEGNVASIAKNGGQPMPKPTIAGKPTIRK